MVDTISMFSYLSDRGRAVSRNGCCTIRVAIRFSGEPGDSSQVERGNFTPNPDTQIKNQSIGGEQDPYVTPRLHDCYRRNTLRDYNNHLIMAVRDATAGWWGITGGLSLVGVVRGSMRS